MNKSNELPTSFVGFEGNFYVLRNEGLSTPAIAPKYARYPSVDAYNIREVTPEYTPANEALTDFLFEQKIYLENLKTTPPTYPSDPDETDLGLTPQRNFWANKFQRALEGRTNV